MFGVTHVIHCKLSHVAPKAASALPGRVRIAVYYTDAGGTRHAVTTGGGASSAEIPFAQIEVGSATLADAGEATVTAGQTASFDIIVKDAGGANVGDDAIESLFAVQEAGKPTSPLLETTAKYLGTAGRFRVFCTLRCVTHGRL